MTICEFVVERFRGSRSETFKGYCTAMANSINTDNLSRRQNEDLALLMNHLDKIYKLRDDMLPELVVDFFTLDKWRVFEAAVALGEENFSDGVSKDKRLDIY